MLQNSIFVGLAITLYLGGVGCGGLETDMLVGEAATRELQSAPGQPRGIVSARSISLHPPRDRVLRDHRIFHRFALTRQFRSPAQHDRVDVPCERGTSVDFRLSLSAEETFSRCDAPSTMNYDRRLCIRNISLRCTPYPSTQRHIFRGILADGSKHFLQVAFRLQPRAADHARAVNDVFEVVAGGQIHFDPFVNDRLSSYLSTWWLGSRVRQPRGRGPGDSAARDPWGRVWATARGYGYRAPRNFSGKTMTVYFPYEINSGERLDDARVSRATIAINVKKAQ